MTKPEGTEGEGEGSDEGLDVEEGLKVTTDEIGGMGRGEETFLFKEG